VPPLASKFCEYPELAVPEGRVEEVIVRASAAAATVMEVAADWVCTGLLLSVTLTVKLEVPLPVGVPEMTPVDEDKLRPAGRLPEATDQV